MNIYFWGVIHNFYPKYLITVFTKNTQNYDFSRWLSTFGGGVSLFYKIWLESVLCF